MRKVLLLKFGELFLKGRNKKDFENLLMQNIRKKLQGYNYQLSATLGRLIVSDYEEFEEDNIIDSLTKVFGLIAVSRATEIETSYQNIVEFVKNIVLPKDSTFRVSVKRADKKFPVPSMQLERELGAIVLENNEVKVDLHEPQTNIKVEIRFNDKTYIYHKDVKCVGGLPLGSAGKGILLLSGGIDSPVAGFLMAKRGLKLEAVHFHSYPYTSQQAKEKVISLAKQLCEYCDDIKLHIVSFTKIQEQIHMNCDSEYMITIMRRIMMRIAQGIAEKNECGAIVTGESLGQVASQTMQSMTVTGSVVDIPVFRPVIAFDKEEIIDVALKIGTFETSVLPYEDCCTVFLPKNPVIRPTIKRATYLEKFLNIDSLVREAIDSEEILHLKRD